MASATPRGVELATLRPWIVSHLQNITLTNNSREHRGSEEEDGVVVVTEMVVAEATTMNATKKVVKEAMTR